MSKAISVLPSHYNFEIHKSIWRILELQKTLNKKVIPSSHTLLEHCREPTISWGIDAVCLSNQRYSDFIYRMRNDDFWWCDLWRLLHRWYLGKTIRCWSNHSLWYLIEKVELLIGHSCLVPINECLVKTLYVFVEISIN